MDHFSVIILLFLPFKPLYQSYAMYKISHWEDKIILSGEQKKKNSRKEIHLKFIIKSHIVKHCSENTINNPRK